MDLRFERLTVELLMQFPTLFLESETVQMQGGLKAGAYIVYSSVFNPYFLGLVSSPDVWTKRKVANLLEKLASSRDSAVVNLLMLEIVPAILKKQETVDAYWPLLGPMTRRKLWEAYPRTAPDIVLPLKDEENRGRFV